MVYPTEELQQNPLVALDATIPVGERSLPVLRPGVDSTEHRVYVQAGERQESCTAVDGR